MHSHVIAAAAAAIVAAGLVNGQQTLWGQCGGINWTGQTSCVNGAACSSLNAYYYQCLAAATSTTGATTTTSMRTTTTTSHTTTMTSRTTTTSTTSSRTTTSSTTTSRTTTTTSSSGSTPTGLKYIFSFGDSYSQTGFDITSTKPSSSNPLGNPAFPGYTTSGGANWLGYLIETYNTTLVYDYNFSYGGATVNASLVTPYTSTVLSMIDQVTQFSNNVASKPSYAPWTSSNSMFAAWLGVNDIGNSYGNGADQVALHNAILDSYFGQLQIMYNAGGRLFTCLNVPPINRTPNVLAQSTSAQNAEATQIAAFNSLLSSRASSWQSSHSGSTVKVVDTQAPFNAVLNNPTAYGLPSGAATCYNSDGVSCAWWNDYHPAMAIHKQVAQAVLTAFKSVGFQ